METDSPTSEAGSHIVNMGKMIEVRMTKLVLYMNSLMFIHYNADHDWHFSDLVFHLSHRIWRIK